MTQQEDHKKQIAHEVIEAYKSMDEEDFSDYIQNVVELDDEGFARGMFVALQIIREGFDSHVRVEFAKEYVDSCGGIEFLEQHLEKDNDIDVETMVWLKFIFQHKEGSDE